MTSNVLIKSAWMTCVFVLLCCSANATQIAPCYEENRQTFWKIFERISPPEPDSVENELITNFCNADAQLLSKSMPVESYVLSKLECYSSTLGQLVIELPNVYFNNCLNPEELIDMFAAKWAHYSLEPVVIVVYNKAQKFYQSSEYSKDHAEFERVRRFREITALHNNMLGSIPPCR